MSIVAYGSIFATFGIVILSASSNDLQVQSMKQYIMHERVYYDAKVERLEEKTRLLQRLLCTARVKALWKYMRRCSCFCREKRHLRSLEALEQDELVLVRHRSYLPEFYTQCACSYSYYTHTNTHTSIIGAFHSTRHMCMAARDEADVETEPLQQEMQQSHGRHGRSLLMMDTDML